MATLLQDIKTQSDWVITAFAADKLKLDYSIHSFIEIDKFFNKHSKNGKAVRGGRLTQNLGSIVFSLGSYVGQTIIKNVSGAAWQTDDNDPESEITASVKTSRRNSNISDAKNYETLPKWFRRCCICLWTSTDKRLYQRTI